MYKGYLFDHLQISFQGDNHILALYGLTFNLKKNASLKSNPFPPSELPEKRSVDIFLDLTTTGH